MRTDKSLISCFGALEEPSALQNMSSSTRVPRFDLGPEKSEECIVLLTMILAIARGMSGVQAVRVESQALSKTMTLVLSFVIDRLRELEANSCVGKRKVVEMID